MNESVDEPKRRLPLELRALLDAEPAGLLAEYLGDRLGLAWREQTLRLSFTDGRFRGAGTSMGSLSPEDFEVLAAREAP